MAIPVNSIGVQVFIELEGEVIPKGLVLENISRPFVDGIAYRERATRGDPFELFGTRDATTIADAEAFKETYKALIGTFVDVVQRDFTSGTMLVIEAVVTDIFRVETPVGGIVAGNYLVFSRFLLQFGGL